MDIRRAREIAKHFAFTPDFAVACYRRGLLVRTADRSSYFVHESGFWRLVFRLAVPVHQERRVCKIEASLKA